MSDRVVAVVQARMGSARLPNKMMLWLNGYAVVDWVYSRLAACWEVEEIVFALPDTRGNDALAAHILAPIYRGSEHDVLGRMTRAAQAYNADIVVRACGDNPCIDPEEVDRLIQYFKLGHWDYVYNHTPNGNLYADGLGAQVVSMATLERVDAEATDSDDREHVLSYIHGNPDFRQGTLTPGDLRLAHPELKLDLDTYEDYQRLLASGVDIDMTAAEIVECFL